jgi:hypothetical protein
MEDAMYRAIPLCLLPLTGCGLSCTLMYAPSQVDVAFDGPDAWPPDTYTIELQGYTQDAMCVLDLPADERDVQHCTSNVFELGLDDEGDAVASIHVFEFAPDGFRVTVAGDHEGIDATADFTPDYDESEPNGNGCGVQRTAALTMAVQ